MSENNSAGCIAIGVVVLLFALLLGGVTLVTTVDEGEQCVVVTNGKAGGVAESGLHFKTPMQDYKCYGTRLQSYENKEIWANTSDGQDILLDISVQYRLQSDDLVNTYATIAKNDSELKDTVVKQQALSITRNAMGNYNATDIFKGEGVVQYQQEVFEQLSAELIKYNVVVTDFNLRDKTFDKAYEDAVTAKKVQEEAVNTERLKLEQIKIQGEQKVASAQAEAESINVVGQALNNNPAYLQQLFILNQEVKWGALDLSKFLEIFTAAQ